MNLKPHVEASLRLDPLHRDVSPAEPRASLLRWASSQPPTRFRAPATPLPEGPNPVARQQKLANLRAAIAEGRYRVSSEDLAQALLNHLQKKRSSTPQEAAPFSPDRASEVPED